MAEQRSRLSMRVLIALLLAACARPLSAQAPLDLNAKLPVPVRFATIYGQRWAYYEAGPVRAPAVVLLHSLGWDAHAWASNFAVLAEHYHVLAIDPLGVGRSDKPLIEYKMGTWTDGFAELLRQ